jgi:hypothetical protein
MVSEALTVWIAASALFTVGFGRLLRKRWPG